MEEMTYNSILIVDDEPIVRESLRDWLQHAGYKVETAQNGEEALTFVKNNDYSIIILDIRLPGKTGIAVLQEIKAIKPQIKSIFISAYPTVEFSNEAKRLGALDFLIKPIVPDDLEKLIKETLEKNIGQL